MAGLEVEGVVQSGPSLDGVVVGEVLAVRPHPDADRLQVCDVRLTGVVPGGVAEDADGGSEPVQIVCGAPNVAAGQRVPVATVGTELMLPARKPAPAEAGGSGLEPVTIKKGKIRGQVSHGMICAEDELGLGRRPRRHPGPGPVRPGRPAAGRLAPPVGRDARRHRPRHRHHAQPPRRDQPRRRGPRPGRPDGRGADAARGGGPGAGRPGGRRRDGPDRGRRGVPALRGDGRARRDRRAVAGLGAGAAARRRRPAGQQRRGRDELRAPRGRPAAPRLRPGPARRRRRSSSAPAGRARRSPHSTTKSARCRRARSWSATPSGPSPWPASWAAPTPRSPTPRPTC